MPGSLRSKLASMRHKRLIDDEEYEVMIKKLEGHDREIRNKTIDEFVKKSYHICDINLDICREFGTCIECYIAGICEIGEQMKKEVISERNKE